MAQIADKLWTLEEFLALRRHRYQLSAVRGRLVAKSPPNRASYPSNRRHSWYKADLPMMNLYHGILP